MSVSRPEPQAAPREAEPIPRPQAAEEDPPLVVATGLVSLGTGDAPTCSDGTCW